jgi:cytochrome c
MVVFRSAALLIALIMISAPRPAVGQAQSQPAAIAPEHQDMAAKRAKEKEKINDCHRQATEQKILPRDRPQFVINCLDGTAERNQPSVVAPEYQELAAKRAKEKERVDGCQKQATEQKMLPRDRPQFVINCLDK